SFWGRTERCRFKRSGFRAVADSSLPEQLAHIVIRGLAAGKPVEIDGLGVFYPDPVDSFRFEPRSPQVFVSYAREDTAMAEQLCQALDGAGFGPWLDVRKLLPGQNWPRAIDSAIEDSDFFLACFSTASA